MKLTFTDHNVINRLEVHFQVKRAVISVLIITLVAVLVLAGSAPAKEIQPPPPRAATEPPTAAVPDWQQEWERTLAEARKEGVLVLYTGGIGSRVRSELGKALSDKFNIRLNLLSGRGQETLSKLGAERRSGLYLADAYIAGTGSAVGIAKPAGYLDPLKPILFLPEVLDPNVWLGGELPWADQDRYNFAFLAAAKTPIVINMEFVKPGEVKSWNDLLNPKWKGKIAFNDPSMSGGGVSTFAAIALGIMDLDYLKRLGKQELAFSRDNRLLVEWVARGKYAIGIGLEEGPIHDMLKAGAPLDLITPVEGSYVTASVGSLSLVNRAPHRNAAKLFANWLLTKEGQTIYSRAYGAQSARIDVPSDFLDPRTVRKPGVKYVNTISEEWSDKKEKLRQVAKEMYNIK